MGDLVQTSQSGTGIGLPRRSPWNEKVPLSGSQGDFLIQRIYTRSQEPTYWEIITRNETLRME